MNLILFYICIIEKIIFYREIDLIIMSLKVTHYCT